MKFKRLATMLMAAAMMVSLVACAGDNGENSETPVSSGNDVVEETEANTSLWPKVGGLKISIQL